MRLIAQRIDGVITDIRRSTSPQAQPTSLTATSVGAESTKDPEKTNEELYDYYLGAQVKRYGP